MSKKIKTALETDLGITAGGDILANSHDLRTRSSNTGGGDVYTRHLFLAPVGYFYITDPSGVRIGYIGPDGSPASTWVINGGAPGTDVAGLSVNLTTGLVSAHNGILLDGALSSSSDALSFNDGTTNVGIRAYATKSASNYALYVDGTLVQTATAAAITNSVATTFSAACTFSSTATFNSTMTTTATVVNAYKVTATSLAANTNNWNPVGVGSTVPTNIRASCSAGISVTGLIAGASEQRITIFNIGSNALSLAHQNASSSAANRFYCPGGAAFSIAPNGAVDLWYDSTGTAGWRVVSK